MMRGFVNDGCELIVPLRIRGVSGNAETIESVLDTGFTEELTLSVTAIARLGLRKVSRIDVALADGSQRFVNIHAMEIEWNGLWRSVMVLAMGDDPLLGMKMIEGHSLKAEAVPGGTIEIVPLP